MDKQALIEKESRWAKYALAAVVIALVLVFVGQGLEVSVVSDAEGDSENLVARAGDTGTAVAGSALRSVGFSLLVVPLLLLFDAAAARSSKPMSRFRLLVIAGPIAFAISSLLLTLSLDSAAKDFVDGAPLTGEAADARAEDLITGNSLFAAGQGFAFAGLIGVVFGVIYSSLQAMRVGLLTRFWGTLGMAFGAFFLIGSAGGNPVGVLGTVFFLLFVSLLAGDRWFRERPAAWPAGVAIPWEPPGGGAPAEEPAPEQELARPEDFEGQGTELDDEGSSERPGRRDNKRKRKRKQR